MEHALASDLSRVQIHDNDRAAKLARQARARAFAIGNDVFFARGALRPRDQDGQRLIAHELVHVVQQQRAAATTIRRFHDPSAESVPVGVGEILTQEEFEWTRTGELQLAPGTVAMKVSRDDDQYLVVPRSAVRLNVHGGYDLLTTHEGEKWGAERNAIKEGRRTSAAARRIVGAPEPGSAPPTRIKQSVREQIKRMEEFQSLPWDQQQAAFQAHQKQSEGSFVGYTEEQLRQMEAQEWARKNQKVIDGSGLIDTVQGHEFRQLAREGEVMQSGIVAGGVLSMTGDLGLAETIANIGNMLTQRAARPSKPPVGPVVRTPLVVDTGFSGTSALPTTNIRPVADLLKPEKQVATEPRPFIPKEETYDYAPSFPAKPPAPGASLKPNAAPLKAKRTVGWQDFKMSGIFDREHQRIREESRSLANAPHEREVMAKISQRWALENVAAGKTSKRFSDWIRTTFRSASEQDSVDDIPAVAPSYKYEERKGLEGWLFWRGLKEHQLPFQGYKLHISATIDNAANVAKILLPMLRKLRIPHKVVMSKEEYESAPNGKFIVAYPRSAEERAKIVAQIDKALTRSGLHGEANFIPVNYEQPLGNTGAAFTRYGANYSKQVGDYWHIMKTNKRGEALSKRGGKPLDFNGFRIGGRPTYGPINVEEPIKGITPEEWGRLRRKLDHEAEWVFDDRDRVHPKWTAPPSGPLEDHQP